MMSYLDKIQTIDRRYLYMALFVAIVLPMIFPFKHPIQVSPLTNAYHDTIEALKPGDIVVFSIDHVAGTLAELGQTETATLNHLLRKDVRIIFWGVAFPDAPLIFDSTLRALLKDKKYGVDYVHFGYIAGREVAAAALGNDIRGLLKTDESGNPIDTLPIMENVREAKDVALLITFDDGYATQTWVQQWFTPHGTKLLSVGLVGLLPSVTPYIKANQVAGAIFGIPGAAEYETRLGIYGKGLARAAGLTTTCILALSLVLIGAGAYVVQKITKGQKVMT